MKIENSEIAVRRIGELQDIDKQMTALYQLKGMDADRLALFISQWPDGSGIRVEHIHRDGNFIPGFYHDILEAAIQRFEAYREKLVTEIEEL